MYIERNNLDLELIRYRKNVDYIHVYFCEMSVQCNSAHRFGTEDQDISNSNQCDHCHF